MLLVPHFLKNQALKECFSRLRFRKERQKYPEGTFMSYFAVFNHLFSEYSSEGILSETTAGINSWKQLEGQTATKFSQ